MGQWGYGREDLTKAGPVIYFCRKAVDTLETIFCAKWQNYDFSLYGEAFKRKACKIATVMDYLLHLLWLCGSRERDAVLFPCSCSRM